MVLMLGLAASAARLTRVQSPAKLMIMMVAAIEAVTDLHQLHDPVIRRPADFRSSVWFFIDAFHALVMKEF